MPFVGACTLAQAKLPTFTGDSQQRRQNCTQVAAVYKFFLEPNISSTSSQCIFRNNRGNSSGILYDKLSTPVSFSTQENHGFQFKRTRHGNHNTSQQPACLCLELSASPPPSSQGVGKNHRRGFPSTSAPLHCIRTTKCQSMPLPSFVLLDLSWQHNCPPRPQLTNQLYNVQAHKSPAAATSDVVQSVDSIVVVSVSTKLLSPCTRL